MKYRESRGTNLDWSARKVKSYDLVASILIEDILP